ncbi:MAG: hypothetical protein ACJ8EF_07785 [Bradyrhizobium sp.]
MSEPEETIAKAAKRPLKDAAYFLYQERIRLEPLLRPAFSDEELKRSRMRPIEEIKAQIRFERDHAADGPVFGWLKCAHPGAADADIKAAITAAAKFNDDCYENFPNDRGDFQKCIDDAVDRARRKNPQYSELTYREARYWVMYYMK